MDRVGYIRAHPELGFRELAYAMIDEYIAYLSPSTVYNILKKHDLIAERKVKYRKPVKTGLPTKLVYRFHHTITILRHYAARNFIRFPTPLEHNRLIIQVLDLY